eukprot:TRINITY_DN287_c3_g2_i1.p1 TRINITY_DN287_c3_g2~~TRINITY_DN287_c3_g2_i1.p1  ORF type:complete len:119 (+),score=38.80 TRINITY_DN287_c3_g2_i1:104-460(+)
MDIPDAFIKHFYSTWGTNRSNLVNLYQAESMLTVEGKKYQGPQDIINKFLEMGQVTHQPSKFDAQPSINGGFLVYTCGLLVIGNNAPVNYSQVFHLLPIPGQPTGFFVYNHIYSLNVG